MAYLGFQGADVCLEFGNVLCEDARARVGRMHVRYVSEPEPLRQALLEIYVAVVTAAKYNDFDTH